MNKYSNLRSWAVTLGVLVACSVPASAQESWEGDVDSLWGEPGNWSTSAVPTGTSAVTLPGFPTSYTLDLGGVTRDFDTLAASFTNNNYTLTNGTLNPGGNITKTNGNGILQISANLNLDGDRSIILSNQAGLRVDISGTLSGAGRLTFLDTGEYSKSILSADNSGYAGGVTVAGFTGVRLGHNSALGSGEFQIGNDVNVGLAYVASVGATARTIANDMTFLKVGASQIGAVFGEETTNTGSLTFTGPVTLARDPAAGDFDFGINTSVELSGAVGETGGAALINVTGPGTLTFSGTTSTTGQIRIGYGISNYSPTPSISGGHVTVAATGNINSVTNISLRDVNSTFTYNGTTALTQGVDIGTSSAARGAFIYNSSAAFAPASQSFIELYTGQTLGGVGTIGKDIYNYSGATLSSGNTATNSIGTLVTQFIRMDGNSNYLWEIADATGSVGTGWDSLDIGGALQLNGTSGSKMNIKITSLTAGLVSGTPANWDPNANYSYAFMSATSITGNAFDPSIFNLDTSDWTPTNPGGWTIDQVGNDLVLNYAGIPEPATALYLLSGIGLLLMRRTRQGRPSVASC